MFLLIYLNKNIFHFMLTPHAGIQTQHHPSSSSIQLSLSVSDYRVLFSAVLR